MRSICIQTQSNVHSIQMPDLHSFDLIRQGQSLIDMCTGSSVVMSHVGGHSDSNINSFEWTKVIKSTPFSTFTASI